MIKNDIVVLAILISLLYAIFKLAGSQHPLLVKLFKIFPPILFCYFLPGVLNSLGILDASSSELYNIFSKYLLPPCLILFTINLDLQLLKKLGPKFLIVFLAGTLGIVIGGPIAVIIVKWLHPSTFDTHTWKGLATIAGSWIGGGANQTALKEVFQPSNELFSQAVAVDIMIAELWLAVLLMAIGNKDKINDFLGSDGSLVENLKTSSFNNTAQASVPSMRDYLEILFVGFGATGLAYLLADQITPFLVENYPDLAKFSLTSTFFWVVAIVTLIGILLSFTKFKNLQSKGSSEIANLFLYLLIASIGMQMNLSESLKNPYLFLVGLIWIIVHAVLIFVVGKWLKVPLFYIVVGSQANVGGAASASVVAAAYAPSLVSIGVILSILGYAIGTYAGFVTAQLLRIASGY